VAIDWKGLRGDFERGEAGFETLAAGYGCKAGTIKRRAVREGWGEVDQSAAMAELKRDGITGEHRLLWSIVKSKLRAGLEKSDLDELKIVKLAGDGILNLQKGETQAWGLTEDDVKTDQQEVIGITQEMAELTVSPGAEEALDGDQAL